jgi:integrase
MVSKTNFRKLKGTTGIYKHNKTGHYYAEKRVKGILKSHTFRTLHEAKRWRNELLQKIPIKEKSEFATLEEVWEVMQAFHFPLLATTTREVWRRRYRLLKTLEHLHMNQITSGKISEWVTYWVAHFSTEEYRTSGRGRAGRCNLNNELNMFVTIFNWYKESEQFESEVQSLTCPVKKKHRKMGFIRPLPDKKKQIDLKDAFSFFEHLKAPYDDLARMQFFTAGRVGEVSGLQWSNIDLHNRRMLIRETCVWDSSNKMFKELKHFPKNKEARAVYITDEILAILKRREKVSLSDNNYVFHIEGRPLNYCTIQVNYRKGQKLAKIPYSGTHILRHGMAKLARQIGGGLDAVIAMTGHKDLKLADHYSKSNEDDQRHFSEKIMAHIRNQNTANARTDFDEKGQSFDQDNVISLFGDKFGTTD